MKKPHNYFPARMRAKPELEPAPALPPEACRLCGQPAQLADIYCSRCRPKIDRFKQHRISS